ncbi:hypothetical protein BD310DRAFT_922186 [Dichomitus squalens]|uniref:Uncharacterized protein n=1 Tax=Dichomitus squalens TaxID=114155 RepID=A0A4Q9Q1W5_9APHY|nr:hypothetical protein BD310DRAFT_922186 [Dichomitus squalens]
MVLGISGRRLWEVRTHCIGEVLWSLRSQSPRGTWTTDNARSTFPILSSAATPLSALTSCPRPPRPHRRPTFLMNPNFYSQILYNAAMGLLQQPYSHPQGYWQLAPQQGLYNPAQQWPQIPYPAMGPMPPQLPLGVLSPVQQQRLQEFFEAMRKEDKKEDPAELGAADEEALVDAFKKGIENGLTPPRILEGLSKKTGRSETEWMTLFVTHVDKLYPKTYPGTNPAPSNPDINPSGLAGGPSVSTRHDERPRNARNPGKPAPIAAKPSANSKHIEEALVPATTNASASAQDGASSKPTVHRPKRGEIPDGFHGDTLIPPSDGSMKPPLPAVMGEPGSKFTKEEKIFFMHWLRWRLREGPLPKKETLFRELEVELPHRTAEVWKKHWGDHSEQPDRVYIDARKRVDREEELRGSPLTDNDGADEYEKEEESDDDQGSPYEDGASPTAASHTLLGKSNKARSKGRTTCVPVKDEDLRAMALYRYENDAIWGTFEYKKTPWIAFSRRPQNSKRSGPAWSSIANNPRHASIIGRYVNEHRRAAEKGKKPMTDIKTSTSTPPQQDSPSTSSTGPRKPREGMTMTQKRSADTDAANEGSISAGKSHPFKKRKGAVLQVKVEPEFIIDLTVG